MKIRKEYIILPLIILAALIYLLLQNNSKMNYKVPLFEPLVKSDVQKITIKNNSEIVELQKEGDSWIMLPEKYKADTGQVNSILSSASSISIHDLISERDDYSRYELDDENGVTVSLYNQSEVLREFVIGKSDTSGVYSYIRLKENKGVYSVSGSLTGVFKTTVEKLRDKQVLSFNPDTINEIEITMNDKLLLFKSAGEGEDQQWSLGDAVYDDSEVIENRIKSLSSLKCMEYLESGIGDPMVTISLKGDSIHKIDILKKEEKGYSAVSSDSKDPFLIPFYLGDEMIALFE